MQSLLGSVVGHEGPVPPPGVVVVDGVVVMVGGVAVMLLEGVVVDGGS